MIPVPMAFYNEYNSERIERDGDFFVIKAKLGTLVAMSGQEIAVNYGRHTLPATVEKVTMDGKHARIEARLIR